MYGLHNLSRRPYTSKMVNGLLNTFTYVRSAIEASLERKVLKAPLQSGLLLLLFYMAIGQTADAPFRWGRWGLERHKSRPQHPGTRRAQFRLAVTRNFPDFAADIITIFRPAEFTASYQHVKMYAQFCEE